MKKLLLLLTLSIAIFTFAQSDSISIYHTERTYRYPKYEDKDLIKLKTENYLIDLKRSGFTITKNEIEEYKIDIDISTTTKDKNIIRFNVVYMFFDTFYTVDLWSPKFYFAKTKKWILLEKYSDDDEKITSIIEDIVFKNYQNEINANF